MSRTPKINIKIFCDRIIYNSEKLAVFNSSEMTLLKSRTESVCNITI